MGLAAGTSKALRSVHPLDRVVAARAPSGYARYRTGFVLFWATLPLDAMIAAFDTLKTRLVDETRDPRTH